MKVSREMMMKSDVWAFGCVVLEVLFYCSPAFYSVGSYEQMRLIQEVMGEWKSMNDHKIVMNTDRHFRIKACLEGLDGHMEGGDTKTSAENFIRNALEINPQLRILSSQHTQSLKSVDK
jgi:serine/threonine protein kinase